MLYQKVPIENIKKFIVCRFIPHTISETIYIFKINIKNSLLILNTPNIERNLKLRHLLIFVLINFFNFFSNFSYKHSHSFSKTLISRITKTYANKMFIVFTIKRKKEKFSKFMAYFSELYFIEFFVSYSHGNQLKFQSYSGKTTQLHKTPPEKADFAACLKTRRSIPWLHKISISNKNTIFFFSFFLPFLLKKEKKNFFLEVSIYSWILNDFYVK